MTGSSKKVIWKTSDEKIAKVSGGTVTGKGAGEATITATANGVSASCKVKVVDGLVVIKDKNIVLYTGEKDRNGKDYTAAKQLKTTATRTEKKGLVWTCSDEKVAAVDTDGKVTAVGAGTAVISAIYKDKTDICAVTVKETSIKISDRDVVLRTKGANKTYQLSCNVVGRNTKAKWTVDNAGKTVVSVSNNG